jgi:hypothetical protein
MRRLFILLVFFVVACSSTKEQTNISNALYFFFDSSNKTVEMRKNYSGYDKINNKGVGGLKYNFKLDSTYVIFTPKDKATRNNPKRIEISKKDTVNLNVKNFDWLNTFTANWRNIVQLRRSKKDIYY